MFTFLYGRTPRRHRKGDETSMNRFLGVDLRAQNRLEPTILMFLGVKCSKFAFWASWDEYLSFRHPKPREILVLDDFDVRADFHWGSEYCSFDVLYLVASVFQNEKC